MKTYVQNQMEWIKKNKIKVGSNILIKRIAQDYENNWPLCWVYGMNSEVGKKCTIFKINSDGIQWEKDGYIFPYFVLEPINNWIPKNGDRVWCLIITDKVTYYDDIYNEKTHKPLFNNGLIFKTRKKVRSIVNEIKNIL